MQRREFLNTSMWGVLGCSVLPGTMMAQSSNAAKVKVQVLLDLLGFRKESFFSVDKSLALCEDYLEPWLKIGYTPLDSRLFWIACDYAVIPVHIENPQLGTLDISMLNFHKSKDGKWDYSGSISGFHIEAIHKAQLEIYLQGNGAEYARHLLLPVPASGNSSLQTSAHRTFLGYFKLSARVSKKQTVVSAKIVEGKSSLWEMEYLSSHLLAVSDMGIFA